MSTLKLGRIFLFMGAAITLLGSAPGVLAQRADLRVISVPEPAGKPLNLDKSLVQREQQAVGSGRVKDVSVIVRFQDEPVASYRGNLPGMPATAAKALGSSRLNPRSPDSQRYRAYLNSRQTAFSAQLRGAVPTARVVHQFQIGLNGMAVVLPESRLSSLAALPGVAAVYEDKVLQLTTDASPAFIGAPALWSRLGGQASAGEGAIIGVLDTGVWPEHPSFSDPDPDGKPYAPPRGPVRPCQFSGGANPGPAFACNNKLIGAYRFMATHDAEGAPLPEAYTSARDDEGHGSHTATTAGGNRDVSASILGRPFGFVSGIAPRAQVVSYKVCGIRGCYSSDSVAAIDQAILDDVDVINFSISSEQNPYSDPVALAFLGAYEAGVFVAASAGNSGPSPNSANHLEPWTTTVAASTSNRQFQSVLTLRAAGGASITLYGASVNAGLSTPTPVFVPEADPYCLRPFAAGSVAGKAVICGLGGNSGPEKSYNILVGGGAAMILRHFVPSTLRAETAFLPAVHLTDGGGEATQAFMAAHTDVTATFTPGTKMPAQGDVIARFSSRGGPGLTLGIAKPDITAPGVQILAGHTANPSTRELGPSGQLFMAIQGTSMSSPHVAGAAALIKALHPDWTPGQIKSALMTTATGVVYKEDAATLATPFDTGSGRIDLAKAGDPGLTFDEAGEQFLALQSALWNANYPSLYVPGFLGQISVERTVKNTRNSNRDWKLVVVGPTDLKVTVPNTISVPALGTVKFRIDVDGRGIPVGGVRHAVIELRRSNEATLRFPVTVVRGTSVDVPLTKTCSPLTIAQSAETQCSITIANKSTAPVNVSLKDQLPNNLLMVSGSVVNATQVGNGLQFSGALQAALPGVLAIGTGGSPADGYLPLSGFGVAPITDMGDESIVNFNVPAFTYAGETYSRIAVSSNGYVVVGGGSGPDVSFNNQHLPDAARPNNVLAPFWTDLDPGAAGAVRVANLTDGVKSWMVVDWDAVREYSNDRRASFQVWIGLTSGSTPAQDISYAYGTIQGNGDGDRLTVGAENRLGTGGQNYYYNGTGTLPAVGTQLRVTSTPGVPGGSRTITYSAKGKNVGAWTDCAELTSNGFVGTQTACVSGAIVK